MFISAVPIGIIVVENDADLEQVRKHINRLHSVRLNFKCSFPVSLFLTKDSASN